MGEPSVPHKLRNEHPHGDAATDGKELVLEMIRWGVYVRLALVLGAIASFAIAAGAGERWAW